MLAWIFVLSRLSFMPFLAVSEVRVYGAEQEIQARMVSAAWAAMDGTYGGLFSRSNMFLYPRSDIAAAVSSSSPRIDHVAVSRSLGTVSISASEKVPEAVVCSDLPDLAEDALAKGSRCYLADDDGYIFRTATSTDAERFMRYYLPAMASARASDIIGSTTPKFATLQPLIKSIKMAGIGVQAVLIKGSDSYELYASNPSGRSLVVIQMSERVPLAVQRDNLLAYWSKMISDSRIEGRELEWSEIKLQYPPNVYSRMAGDRAAEPADAADQQ